MASPLELQTDPLTTRVRSIVEEVLVDEDLFIVEVSVRGWKGSRVVEIYLDGDNGMDVDRLAAISREVGFLLDAEDVVEGKYKLDVSSPGADKPLIHPRQFSKHVGRTLDVSFTDEDGNAQSVQGPLTEATPEALTLTGPENEPVTIPHAQLQQAVVVLPW